eukprot:bmy_12059T0
MFKTWCFEKVVRSIVDWIQILSIPFSVDKIKKETNSTEWVLSSEEFLPKYFRNNSSLVIHL